MHGRFCDAHQAADRQAFDARRADRPGRRWYKTARWKALRVAVLAREPLCRMCGGRGLVVAAAVVDHVRPHRGDEALFFALTNLQPLCKPCHDGAKQAEERRGEGSQAKGEGGANPSNPGACGPVPQSFARVRETRK